MGGGEFPWEIFAIVGGVGFSLVLTGCACGAIAGPTAWLKVRIPDLTVRRARTRHMYTRII